MYVEHENPFSMPNLIWGEIVRTDTSVCELSGNTALDKAE